MVSLKGVFYNGVSISLPGHKTWAQDMGTGHGHRAQAQGMGTWYECTGHGHMA